jgi:cytochrome c oxidase cbb3-type subunit 1
MTNAAVLSTARHSLGWLVIANTIGLLLALGLVAPPVTDLLAPLSYGRWMPLHLNLQLYGWCALPLVALLFHLFAPAGRAGWQRLALALWSVTLAIGAGSWLAGTTSGKLFLDWHGPYRLLLGAMLGVLWLILAGLFARRWRSEGRLARTLKVVGLLVLGPVPAAMIFASGQGVYPPINPSTGGPTGVSLLFSSLPLCGLFLYLPHLLGLAPRQDAASTTIGTLALLAHGLAASVLGHGDGTHRQPEQQLAMVSLIPWLLFMIWHWQRFTWPPATRRWRAAVGVWAAWLLLTAIITYFPGILDRLKFTNSLVAHSHAAMAGLLTSFNLLLLTTLGRAGELPAGLHHAGAFWAWQLGCASYVLAFTVLGWVEGGQPGLLFAPSALVSTVYGLRLLAGGAMWAASLAWWWQCRPRGAAVVTTGEVTA